MSDPTPPRSFRFNEEELAILWWYAREERRSQRGMLGILLYRHLWGQGGELERIVRAYREAHPSDKAAQE